MKVLRLQRIARESGADEGAERVVSDALGGKVTEADRAALARTALDAYIMAQGQNRDGMEENEVDLIADLLHLAAQRFGRKSLRIMPLLDRARQQFQAQQYATDRARSRARAAWSRARRKAGA